MPNLLMVMHITIMGKILLKATLQILIQLLGMKCVLIPGIFFQKVWQQIAAIKLMLLA